MNPTILHNCSTAFISGTVRHGGACRYLAIFGVNVQHLLISGSSMAVAFAFVFGNSLREVYESILWLFVVNPYDEGSPPSLSLCVRFNSSFS